MCYNPQWFPIDWLLATSIVAVDDDERNFAVGQCVFQLNWMCGEHSLRSNENSPWMIFQYYQKKKRLIQVTFFKNNFSEFFIQWSHIFALCSKRNSIFHFLPVVWLLPSLGQLNAVISKFELEWLVLVERKLLLVETPRDWKTKTGANSYCEHVVFQDLYKKHKHSIRIYPQNQ